MTRWAMLTGEYPPQPGGVSDYTRLVARGLTAAGDSVCVYAPDPSAIHVNDETVAVHRLPGHYGPQALAALDALLRKQPQPDRILVQYVPQAFGWKGMNLLFALWLAARACRIAPVWVMFHEVATPFMWRPVRHALLAGVTRMMARLVAGAADRVFVAIPAWGAMLHRLCPRMKQSEWAPVPSNIGTAPRPTATPLTACFPEVRGRQIIGHFGSYGSLIAQCLEPALLGVLESRTECAAILFGDGGDAFCAGLLERHPALAGRVFATGRLDAEELADTIAQCDLVLQLYPDGISARRGTAMAVLAVGVPMVTNAGAATEPIWATGGVAIAKDGTLGTIVAKAEELLLASRAERTSLGRRGLQLYCETFAIEHTIAKLRGDRPSTQQQESDHAQIGHTGPAPPVKSRGIPAGEPEAKPRDATRRGRTVG
jgi:Glycosyl transferase 4-like domain